MTDTPETSLPELKIIDTEPGTGREAGKGALVQVHYDGFLTDGTSFDSSRQRGRAFQFVLGAGKVIKGWDQGLMGMKEGGKRTLQIPAHLAYGPRAVGKIPPNSDLVFHVELLEALPRE